MKVLAHLFVDSEIMENISDNKVLEYCAPQSQGRKNFYKRFKLIFVVFFFLNIHENQI